MAVAILTVHKALLTDRDDRFISALFALLRAARSAACTYVQSAFLSSGLTAAPMMSRHRALADGGALEFNAEVGCCASCAMYAG
jgi:hypothetical protein